MSMELDDRQQMKTASRTMADMAGVFREALLERGLPDDLADKMTADWFRITILPSIAPDPLADLKDTMRKMFPQGDE